MGVNSVPAASSGISSVVSTVQRGTAATSGNITISSVNTAKTIVNSFSTAASGSVAGSGTLSAATGNASLVDTINGVYARYGTVGTATLNYGDRGIALNTTNFSGGSTNIVTAVFGVYLSNATTLVATGACRYEVIEYV
jgi:hypothetical protein